MAVRTKNAGLTRREFVNGALGSAAALSLAGHEALALPTPLRGRFVTHVSVVRVNQIEVTPTTNLGEDEAPLNSPDHIRSRRDAFAAGAPDGKMTWAISWLALIDQRQEYKDARRLLASYHDKYGDEITFIPGGYFAPMYRHAQAQSADDPQGAGHDLGVGRQRISAAVSGRGLSGRRQPALSRHGRGHSCVPGPDLEPARHRQRRRRRRHLLSLLPQPRALPETGAREGRLHRLRLPRRLDLRFSCRRATRVSKHKFNSRLGVGPIETVGASGLKQAARK